MHLDILCKLKYENHLVNIQQILTKHFMSYMVQYITEALFLTIFKRQKIHCNWVNFCQELI